MLAILATAAVLILGDSVSCGYTPYVSAMLEGEAIVQRPDENCGPSEKYLQSLDGWLGDCHWDVVHVNFGIWDNHYMKEAGTADTVGMLEGPEIAENSSPLLRARAIHEAGYVIRTPADEYEKNLRIILEKLKSRADHVIFALTTPMRMWEGDDRAGRIPVYNEIAAKVCRELGVRVNDLHSLAEHHLDLMSDGCHYCEKGYEILGAQVAQSIRAELSNRN